MLSKAIKGGLKERKNKIMTLGEAIRLKREEKGYSMYKLSQISSISAGEIASIENGSRYPQGRTLKRLADALECDYHSLFKLIER